MSTSNSIGQSPTGSTTNRIAGLASGMDTESTVNNLINIRKQKTVDPFIHKRQVLQWQQEDFRTVNTKLLALNNSVFDLTLQGTFAAKTVSSDNTAVAVTANPNAVAGYFSFQVLGLASGVSKESTPLQASYVHTGANQNFTLTGKRGSAAISVAAGDTIDSIVASINQQSSTTGIKATYDSSQNKFYLITSDTGSEAKIQIDDTHGLLAGVLGVDTSTQNGSNARVKFNGGSELSFSSNQFTFNNMNITLKKSGETAHITVGTDTDSIVAKIKTFVEAYNNALTDINGRLSEKRYREYKPLTDEQKKEMSETQIEQWETRAKSGLLRGEMLLITASSNIRNGAMSGVSGLASSTYTNLSSIGINTENYQDNGKLVINEDQLRAAIAADPEAVSQLFTKQGSDTASSGIAQRLYTEVKNDMKYIKNKAGSASDLIDQSTIGQDISEVDQQEDLANDRLKQYENRLWTQYNTLEKALQRLNSQSSYIMSLFNSNNSGES